MKSDRITTHNALGLFALAVLPLLTLLIPAYGQSGAAPTDHERFFALTLGNREDVPIALNRYGVPFLASVLPLHSGGQAQVTVDATVTRIFLLGMTDALDASRNTDTLSYSLHSGTGPKTIPAYGWADPRDESVRFFVGDELGRICLAYADGTTQIYPLVLGENIWWGRAFYDFQQPFPMDAHLRGALAASLRLYPPVPLEDGNYLAVIAPKHVPIRTITVEDSSAKKGTVIIKGITVQTSGATIRGATELAPAVPSPEIERFAKTKSLRHLNDGNEQALRWLATLRAALYTSNRQFSRHVAQLVPDTYVGPDVSFQGTITADILANVFRFNLKDIADKIDADGMYHTSTRNAASWGGYRGFGTFRPDVGSYYDVSYTRDMGRSLQELALLGDTHLAERCADFDLRMARRYAVDPALKLKDASLPPHWSMLVNRPRNSSLENDGQGLTILFIYRLWQRLPDRETWLRTRWDDVKAAGDWILWQFDHPEISGAKDGLLHTTGESANGSGYSVYPDAICMYALRALAQMGDSVGDTDSAARWRNRAERMRRAITSHYIVTDPRYGQVWSLESSNWIDHSSVLGPLIFQPDFLGFAPEDNIPEWRSVNEAAYQRLLDTYKPFGFYGQAMGYGQAFVTQSALLLDHMHDATHMLDWAARQIYDRRIGSFIVPEGVQIDPTGQESRYKIGDLGNGVQEAEVVKMLRLVLGVDDTQPDRLQFFPRLPYGWRGVAVKKYPITFTSGSALQTALLNFEVTRSGRSMALRIFSDSNIGAIAVRLGPFAAQPVAHDVRVNGHVPAKVAVEHSGDSWWTRFTVYVRSERHAT